MLPSAVRLLAAAILLAVLMRKMGQPALVGYILAGALMGEHGLNWIGEREVVQRIGSMGVVFLVFFIGLEIPLASLRNRAFVAIGGVVLQILCSVGVAFALGYALDWPTGRILLIGFVLTMSSSAVILRYLQDRPLPSRSLTEQIILITITQDLAIIPMLILLQFAGSGSIDVELLVMQVCGGLVCVGVVTWLATRKAHLPWALPAWLRAEPDSEVLLALLLCLGLATLSAVLGLSTALGAFVAGLILASIRDGAPLARNLESFKVVCLALFFVSIGSLLSPVFILENAWILAFLLGVAFILNTVINTGVLRVFGNSWRQSIFGGSILAQIGEFSFLITAVGHTSGVIGPYAYQLAVATIALSLMLSPLWISLFHRRTFGRDPAPG